jgi:prevent-host-death family protein
MNDISAVELRDRFAEVINRVAFGHERFFLTRRGKRVAAVVPVEEAEEPAGEVKAGSASSVAATVRAIRGRYAQVATGSDDFAARKTSEKEMEER